jgi:hypothetical protein
MSTTVLIASAFEDHSDGTHPPRFETLAAMDRLNRILDLPYRDDMQDWAILLADAARIGAF